MRDLRVEEQRVEPALFRDRGATRVGLGVDGESTTGAVRLYESVGMRQVRRSDTYEKTL